MSEFGRGNSTLIDPYGLIYGEIEFNNKLPSLFYLGTKETNVNPGSGPKENNKLNKQWRELKILTLHPNRLLWRQILSNHFDQHPIYKSKQVGKGRPVVTGYKNYIFTLDGMQWVSVIHYLLFKLYSPGPEYAILFSFDSKENENSFWGETEVSLREHKKNITDGGRKMNENFLNELPEYIYHAILAKVSQHEDLKMVLAATGDAFLAERMLKEDGTSVEFGRPILMKVREVLNENPDLVYLNTGQTEVIPDTYKSNVRKIKEIESHNYGFDKQKPLAGNVSNEDICRPLSKDELLNSSESKYIVKEPIDNGIKWIYVLTSPVNIEDLKQEMSNLTYSYDLVERHAYGFTRNFDSQSSKILIGYEKYATSKVFYYHRFTTENRIYYFQELEGEEPLYSLFVITPELDEYLTSYMGTLIDRTRQPTGYNPTKLSLPEIKYTDSQIKRINNNRTIIDTPLTLNQAVYQYNTIKKFTENYKIQNMNPIMRKRFLKALVSELKLRSYTNGENLLYSPGSSFIREFSSEFGFDQSFIKKHLEIENIPDDDFKMDSLDPFLKNHPPNIGLKHWIILNSFENVEKIFTLRTALIFKLSELNTIYDDIFRPFPPNDSEKFRGFSWLQDIPELKEKEKGLIFLCQVPSNKIIEGIFLERAISAIQKSLNLDQPLQLLITCRAEGPLYDFLMKETRVIFRRILDKNYMLENPFTGNLEGNSRPLLMAVLNSDFNFSGLNLEILDE